MLIVELSKVVYALHAFQDFLFPQMEIVNKLVPFVELTVISQVHAHHAIKVMSSLGKIALRQSAETKTAKHLALRIQTLVFNVTQDSSQ